MKMLFVTNVKIGSAANGGEVGSNGRLDLIKQLVYADPFSITKESNLSSVCSLVEGNYPPLRKKHIQEAISLIDKEGYDVVFVDCSVYGGLIKRIKENRPDVKVIAYFQNCEYDYIEVRFKGIFNIKKYVYKYLVKKSEKESLRYSDINVALSDRDSDRIEAIYNKRPDKIIPLFIPDRAGEVAFAGRNKGYCLLFGPANTANLEGFRWFASQVSPYIHIPTLICGKNMERHMKCFQGGNITVKGYVEDIKKLYENALAVCIPLFRGGGMKVKTSESLMYGKTIFGTKEAFAGFHVDYARVGGLCANAGEFIDAINTYTDCGGCTYNRYSRELYLSKYSQKAIRGDIEELLRSIQQEI